MRVKVKVGAMERSSPGCCWSASQLLQHYHYPSDSSSGLTVLPIDLADDRGDLFDLHLNVWLEDSLSNAFHI